MVSDGGLHWITEMKASGQDLEIELGCTVLIIKCLRQSQKGIKPPDMELGMQVSGGCLPSMHKTLGFDPQLQEEEEEKKSPDLDILYTL